MSKHTKTISNVRVGKPDITPDRASHIKGVRQGNNPAVKGQAGIVPYEEGMHNMARGTAERSTGINPDSRNPIDAKMPNLSPA